MIYSLYADFNPNDKEIHEEYVELTENDLCWPHDIEVPTGSFYRYSSVCEWNFTRNATICSLCCAGDYLEVVEPGTLPKRTVYTVV
ncbi:MAG: hypothetical protein IJB74_04470 [Clostridia bacterium]|nr:hypothetical protein [Clostridia bacterium]